MWYTRVEGEKEMQDCLNLQKVIRAISLPDNTLLVLMDDLHQRMQEIPVHNKQGKVTAMKNVMNAFQSEIILSKIEDIENFKKLTNE
jgi:hypothetical protein